MAVNYDQYLQAGRRGAATQGGGAGSIMKTGGAGLMTAGSIPSPASPFLLGAGLGLEAIGAGYDWYQNTYGEPAKRRKKEEEMTDEQWRLQRQQMLMELAKEKEKTDWRRRFMNAGRKGVANA